MRRCFVAWGWDVRGGGRIGRTSRMFLPGGAGVGNCTKSAVAATLCRRSPRYWSAQVCWWVILAGGWDDRTEKEFRNSARRFLRDQGGRFGMRLDRRRGRVLRRTRPHGTMKFLFSHPRPGGWPGLSLSCFSPRGERMNKTCPLIRKIGGAPNSREDKVVL